MKTKQISLLDDPIAQVDFSESDFTDSDQRYTPPHLVDCYGKVLGGIGLDPVANPQKTVPARHHITERENCLTTPWEPLLAELPTVYMNPPFSDSFPFIQRMAHYLRGGHINAAITLTLAGALANKKTQPIIQELAIAVCHPFGRVNFIGAGTSNDRDVVTILWGKAADLGAFKAEVQGLITIISPSLGRMPPL